MYAGTLKALIFFVLTDESPCGLVRCESAHWTAADVLRSTDTGRFAQSFRLARPRPDVQAAIRRVAIDRREFLGRERRALQRAETILDLRPAARADQGARHRRLTQHPRDRHLREGLPASLCNVVERADIVQILLGQHAARERAVR